MEALQRRTDEATELARTAAARLAANGSSEPVYAGGAGLIHVPNGERSTYGERAADFIDRIMRVGAEDVTQADRDAFSLCPGCYMVVLFNTALSLAQRSGQNYRELGRSMAAAFQSLADGDGTPELVEEICVILDKEED